MRRIHMGSLGLMAAAMAASVGAGAKVVQVTEPPKDPPPAKKKAVRKKRAKATYYRNEYSWSKYIPGGSGRNCGELGVSPKSYFRKSGFV